MEREEKGSRGKEIEKESGRGKAERRTLEIEESRWMEGEAKERERGRKKGERINFAESWKTVMPSKLLSSDFRCLP